MLGKCISQLQIVYVYLVSRGVVSIVHTTTGTLPLDAMGTLVHMQISCAYPILQSLTTLLLTLLRKSKNQLLHSIDILTFYD